MPKSVSSMSFSTRSSISFGYQGESLRYDTVARAATRRRNNKKKMARHNNNASIVDELRKTFKHIKVSLGGVKQRKLQKKPRFAEMDPNIKEILDKHPSIIPTGLNLSRYTFFQPSDRAQMDHLAHFDRPVRTLQPGDKMWWDRAAAFVELLCAPKVRPAMPSLEDLADVPYSKSKYAGYEYAQRGMRTRGEANTAAQADAEEAFVQLMEGVDVDPHMVRMGGRGKLANMTRQEAEEGDQAKGRLILMLSQRDLKLLGITEKPCTELAKDPDVPIWIGKHFFFGGSTALAKLLQPYSKFYCCDAKKFDSSIDPYMVDTAVSIIRRWFKDGEEAEYDAYWNFVKRSLLDSVIVRDDGVIFQKNVGTTSGHSHNTLLQSIITLTLAYMALMMLNPDKSDEEIYQNAFVGALGDDNLLAITELLKQVSVEELAEVVRRTTGIEWGGEKSFATSGVADILEQYEEDFRGGEFEGIQFLGKYFKRFIVEDDDNLVNVVVPYRPADETIVKCCFPERQPSQAALEMFTPKELTYQRLVGHYIDNAANPHAAAFLNACLDDLEAQGIYTECTPTKEWRIKMFGDFDDSEEPEVKVRRFTFEQWLDLVVADKRQVVKQYGSGKGVARTQMAWDDSDSFPEIDEL